MGEVGGDPGVNAAVFLSARNKSTRLKRKELVPIQGRAAIELLMERLKTVTAADRIVLCTSTHPDDAVLCELARRWGIETFRGDPEDKLARYEAAAERYGVDFAVVVDGDDLLCDPPHIDAIIVAYGETGADFIIVAGLPLGCTGFGVSREALEKICQLKAETDTEVWGPYFTETGLFRTLELPVRDPRLHRPDLRMTLDYPEDLRFFEAVFERLYRPGHVFSLREVIDLVEREPWIAEINRGVQAQYESNLRKAAPLRLRNVRGGAASL